MISAFSARRRTPAGHRAAALVLSALLLFASHARGEEMRAWQGHQSSITAFEVRVVRQPAAWDELWKSIGRAVPAAWREGQIAVAAFAGLKPSGGYGISITKVERGKCVIVVRFAEKAPGAHEAVIKILTTPWSVTLVETSELPVVFEREGDASTIIPESEGARLAQAKEGCAAKSQG